MLCMCSFSDSFKIGPLHDLVKWYKVTHAGTQVAGDSKQSLTFKTRWDIQNKGRSTWTGTSCFILEPPLGNLSPGMCDFAPCDRIVQIKS